MKLNAGAWIGIIGGIIGLLAGIIAVLATAGETGIYVTLGILVFIGGMGFLFYKLLFGPMLNAGRLQKMGIPGKALITEVRDTGVTINNNPQVKLMLEVKNSFGQKYTTVCRTLVSRLQPWIFQPGMEVAVKIDPKNEKNVIIDLSATRSKQDPPSINYSTQDANTLKTDLEQMQKEYESIRLTGRSARAIIKNYTWLGMYVNGNNPYVEIDLEVLPEMAPSFSGKTKGVIAEASVPKYQPGKEILVKYDVFDNSRIVIDHS